MALGQLKSLFQETLKLSQILSLPPSITFFSEDDFSYLTMEGYVEKLAVDPDSPVVYITSDPKDPVIHKAGDKFRTYALQHLGLKALTMCKAPVLVMTMPDLGSLHVAKPSRATRCVYVFHALVSVQRQYRQDAFDHYDDFFCAGEYHVEELTRRFESLGKPCPRLHRVGYYKLDRIIAHHQGYQKKWTDRPTILLAPSWHAQNILETAGSEIVEQLLACDYRVIVRPHPAFFATIYPKGKAVIQELEQRFSAHPFFVLDTTMNSEESFHEADLLITDWSGSAFEYAFGTERPVLFVDTPPKIRNEHWTEYGIPPFEVTMREQLGLSISPQDIRRAGELATQMLKEGGQYRSQLSTLREQTIFNVGRSASVGADLLKCFLKEAF